MTDLEQGLRDILATVEFPAAVPAGLVGRLHRRHSRLRAVTATLTSLTVIAVVIGSGAALRGYGQRRAPAVTDPAMSSTSTKLITTLNGLHSVVLRIQRADGTVERELSLPASAGFLAVSPDARWLAYEDSRGVELTPVSHLTPRLLVRGRTAAPFGWSPDSRQIVYRSTDQSVSIVEVDNATNHTLAGHLGFAYDASWSPDGAQIAVATLASTGPDGNEQMQPGKAGKIILFASSGKRVRTISTSCAAPSHPRWSPNQDNIAWYCGWLARKGTDPWPPRPVQILNLTTGELRGIGTKESRQPSWLSNEALIVVPTALPDPPTPTGKAPPVTDPTSAMVYDPSGRLLRTLRLAAYDDLQTLVQPDPS